jgi:peroxiredoxin
MLVATELPAKGEVDYLKKMGVTRLNETFDAPTFLLPDLEGKKISLHKFQGKFVMLNFWATWWTFCGLERSSLEKIHHLYKKKGMIVLAVSIDRGSDDKVSQLVKSYVHNKNLTFINLLDPKSSVAAQYGVRGVPMTFFINPEGRVVAFARGYRNWESEEGLMMIEQLLSDAT